MESLISNEEMIVGLKGKTDFDSDSTQDSDEVAEPSLDFFKERNVFLATLDEILSVPPQTDDGISKTRVKLCSMISLMDKYREDPSLLDPHIVALVRPIFTQALLPHVESGDTEWSPYLSMLCSFVYALSTICGYKSLSFSDVFPHQVFLIGPLVTTTGTLGTHWESRYVLTLWVSVLVQSPFTFDTLGIPGLQDAILEIGLANWCNRSMVKASSVLLSRVFARADGQHLLEAFIQRLDFSLDPHLEIMHKTLQVLPRNRLSLIQLEHIATHLDPQSVRGRRLAVSIWGDIAVFLPSFDLTELCIDSIFTFFADKDGCVRFAAAKNIGRIARSLPTIYRNQLIQYVFSLANDPPDHYHSVCLCISEISRRFPLEIIQVLPRAVELATNALEGASLSSLTRDAACLLVWSLSRSTERDLLYNNLVVKVVPSLLITALFDRDINLRRAAAAALQELLGRTGSTIFPSGLSIISIVDFWSVSDVSNSYLRLPSKLLQELPDPEWRSRLTSSFINHLRYEKLMTSILRFQALSAEALALLIDPNSEELLTGPLCEIAIHESVEWFERTGALSFLSCYCRLTQSVIPESLQSAIRNIVPIIEKRRLYRGKGGDAVRRNAYTLLESVYRAFRGGNIEFKDESKYFVKCLEILSEGVRHLVDSVQASAVRALASIASESQPHEHPILDEIILIPFIKKLSTEKNCNVAERRGMIHTLAEIGSSDYVLDLLVKESLGWPNHYLNVRDYVDPVARRLALKGVVRIGKGSEIVVKTLLHAIEDFQSDKRGDVGSMVRQQGIHGLVEIRDLVDPRAKEPMETALLAHSCEKLDRIRLIAKKSISSASHVDEFQYVLSLIPEKDTETGAILLRHLIGSISVHAQAETAFRAFINSQTTHYTINLMEVLLAHTDRDIQFQSRTDYVCRFLIPFIDSLSLFPNGNELHVLVESLFERTVPLVASVSSLASFQLLKSVSRLYSRFVRVDLKLASFCIDNLLYSSSPKLRHAFASDLILACIQEEACDELIELLDATDWTGDNSCRAAAEEVRKLLQTVN
jgi:HEAT repeat protein